MMVRLGRLRSDDSGWAMVSVLATMLTLSLAVALAITSAQAAIGTSRTNQHSQAALAAAQAGVQHYLNELNMDSAYHQLDPALSQVADVPLSAGSDQSFSYEVRTSPAEVVAGGSIVLESTGTSQDVERTVQVTLRRKSIFDYLYYTEFETLPPLVVGNDPVACSKPNWGPDPRSDAACTPLRFSGPGPDPVTSPGDVINGPLHSQDRLLVKGDPGPVFNGPVDTAVDPAYGPHWVAEGVSTPQFLGGEPTYYRMDFPPFNAALQTQAASNGCTYTGPTRVLFHPDGTMTVTSPWTTGGSLTCGSFTSTNNWTDTVPVPNNGVIWVGKSASTSCTLDQVRDATGFPVRFDDGSIDDALIGGTTPLFHNCTAGTVFVEGWLDGRTTLAAADNVFVTGSLRYVGAGDSAYTNYKTTPGTDPAVAAATSGDDVLGLHSASGYVAVYHPIKCTSRTTSGICTGGSTPLRSPDPVSTTQASVPTSYPMTDVQIDAAILSPQAFLVPEYFLGGALGKLTVVGAIAQRFRGPVGSVNSVTGVRNGYTKNYHYDTRLPLKQPPPYLADEKATAWGVADFAEGRS